ncbi:outer membrane beta-barrel protein [Nevskia sp.]|uniref:outer membrane beta-barrel protein n=1 Tax=Nevskia sp. TaxID=1929292 RepID=UPI0025FFA464|nr:outer membrane beta-barrel protein [Nevskia sp.]
MSNYKKLLSVAGLACLPGMAFADTPTLSSILEASGISISGYTSASYSVNYNEGNRLNNRAYDSPTDTFTIDQASLTLGYAPESGFGATVNLLAGEDSTVINGNYGDNDSIFSLPTAYVSYAGGGFTVIAGRFGSLAGYEVTADNAAPFVSRSFLFQNTQPFFHTGLRVTYKASDLLTFNLGAVNSAPQASTRDANKQKTLEANVTLTPTSTVLVALTNYLGVDDFEFGGTFPVAASTDDTFTTRTNLTDLVAQWTPTEKLTLAFNGDIADFKGIATTRGAAFYGFYKFTDLVALRGRVEIAEFRPKFDAPVDKYKVYTVALVVSPSSSFDIIAESRFDTANNDVFLDGDGLKDSGGNFAVKGIFKF